MLVSSKIILFDSRDMNSTLSQLALREILRNYLDRVVRNDSSIGQDDNTILHQVDLNIQTIRRIHLLENYFPIYHTTDNLLRRELVGMNEIDEMLMNAILEDSFIHDPIPLQPVPDIILKQLRTIDLDEDKLTKYHQCSICLEDFVLKEKVINLTCDHFYHETCIFQWFKKQNTCPICKKTVVSSN